jgi:hypothetical protein
MFCIKLCGLQSVNGFVAGDKDSSLRGIVISDGEDGIKAL